MSLSSIVRGRFESMSSNDRLELMSSSRFEAFLLFQLASGLIRGRTLRNKNQTQVSSPPFFIVGSGRSGNTLLRAILNAHNELSVPPESYVLGAAIKEYRMLRFLPWNAASRLVLSKFQSSPHFHTWGVDLSPLYSKVIRFAPEKQDLASLLDAVYRFYAHEHGHQVSRWGDKTPMNSYFLPMIDKVFPSAQYIHILRDGRDASASYVRANIQTDLASAGHRWETSVKRVRGFGANLPTDRFLEIRYEELVTDPTRIVKVVCNFLNIAYQPQMLSYHEQVAQMGDTHLEHHQNLQSPINPNSIGKWRISLSVEDQSKLQRLLRDTLQETGYI